MGKKITKKDFITLEQLEAELYNTPEKKAKFERYYEKARRRFRARLLKEIGQKVKRERKKQGITQEKLARKLQTSQSTINRVEKGEQNLTIGYLDRISEVLGLRYEVNIRADGEENTPKRTFAQRS